MRFPASILRLLWSSLLVLGLLASRCHAQQTASRSEPTGQAALQWKCSTADHPWVDKPAVPITDRVSVPSEPSTLVLVNSKRQSQVIDGWGGCFNERGWKAMEVLSPAAREEVMRSLFDPTTGLKLNLCRTPIGASDYAISLYSLDGTPNDYAMEHFSIRRDEEKLIPYIKAALAIRPDLALWAVPWSPPAWMKDNDNLLGGHIKDDAHTLDALALYFTRYVQAYKAAGISIGIVMEQNEPTALTNYTSCGWTGEQLAKFIGYHLGPEFERERLETKIYLGTINDSSRGGYAYWVGPSMQDPRTRKYLTGLGCQYGGVTTMGETHFLLPELKLMQSEEECGSTNFNDWPFAEKQYALAKRWFAAGAGSNMIWNLVLDETGRNTAGWAQCSPIVVDSNNGHVSYTPYYYCYKHFSYFVEPDAHVIATQSDWGDKIAFVNPDGAVVVVMGNSSNEDRAVTLNIDGAQAEAATLPAHSFSTFVLSASLASRQVSTGAEDKIVVRRRSILN